MKYTNSTYSFADGKETICGFGKSQIANALL